MTPPTPPAWLDRDEYPFTSRWLHLPDGRLHYVDEGEGEPVLFVHGNPTWSFAYRHLVKGLRDRARCVAVDHLGFGLSDKPAGGPYRPADHAERLLALVDHLDLRDMTLVVQDWGGPIGLSVALERPDRVKRIVLLNTWMWPVNGDPHYERFSGFMGGAVGRFLIRRANLFVRAVMPKAVADARATFPKPVLAHYLHALPTPASREACAVLPREILDSRDWLEGLWDQRDALGNVPTLVLWGDRDIAFRKKELDRWRTVFSDARVVTYPDAGHYVQEEKAADALREIRSFLAAREVMP